jgi:hypothetical protein
MRAGETVSFTVDGHPATPAGPDAAEWLGDRAQVEVDLAASSASLSMQAALASIAGQYDYVLGEVGTYSPSPPYPGANTLDSLEAGKSYFLRTLHAGDLLIGGRRLSNDTALSLSSGWNWIGYLPTEARDLPEVLRSAEGGYDCLLGDAGTYAPPPAHQFLNTLGRMEPGAGYLIRMTREGTPVYGN